MSKVRGTEVIRERVKMSQLFLNYTIEGTEKVEVNGEKIGVSYFVLMFKKIGKLVKR